MMSHLAGSPQGPSLSFSCSAVLSCGVEDAFAAAGVVAGAEVVVVPFVAAAAATAGFSVLPSSSHGCALATAS
jgi:hypothetical protein